MISEGIDPAEAVDLLQHYPYDTGLIRYRYRGQVRDWFLGATPNRDNGNSLRAHLITYCPEAEMIGWAIQ